MEKVDYVDSFIAVADDCPVMEGTPPPAGRGGPSIVARSFAMIHEHPYRYTSAEVIFTVYADRRGIAEADREEAWAEFYARGQACLRASDLGRRYGWGIHADAEGRLALVGMETDAYRRFVAGEERAGSGEPVALTRAMARARARA